MIKKVLYAFRQQILRYVKIYLDTIAPCIVIPVSRALEQDSLVRKHEALYTANNLHTER